MEYIEDEIRERTSQDTHDSSQLSKTPTKITTIIRFRPSHPQEVIKYVDSHAINLISTHTTKRYPKHRSINIRFTQPSSDDVPIRNVVEYDVPSPHLNPIHRASTEQNRKLRLLGNKKAENRIDLRSVDSED